MKEVSTGMVDHQRQKDNKEPLNRRDDLLGDVIGRIEAKIGICQ